MNKEQILKEIDDNFADLIDAIDEDFSVQILITKSQLKELFEVYTNEIKQIITKEI